MTRYIPLSPLLALAFITWSIAGCTSLPVGGVKKEELSVVQVAHTSPAAPWSVNPVDSGIAFGKEGLILAEPDGGSAKKLATAPPTALAWSPDGKRLAAALPGGDATTLTIFSRQGESIGKTTVPGRVTCIDWASPADLVALGVEMRVFSFGGDVSATLYRWDGTAAPQPTRLFDVTVKPHTIKQWKERAIDSLTMAMSPERDVILYSRLHDPPAFTPYLRLVMRNLESGAEREIATVGLASGGGRFVGNGDLVVYGDGSSQTRLVDVWNDTLVRTFPTPGKRLATSTGGEYLLLDGRLYHGETEIASFPPTAEGSFLPGGGLRVRHGEEIYRAGGLAETVPVPLSPVVTERLRMLRTWRSEGLISDREYRDERKRIVK